MSTQYINNLNSVSNTILYYPILVLIPVGIIGNVFSFYIYTRPNLNKKTNTGFLYAWLCLLNLVFMLNFVLIFRSSNLFNFAFSLPCGVSTYLLRLTFCFVPWMQAIISFDRLIAILYPHKKHVMSKKWVLSLIMLGTLALLAVANMPNLLSYPQFFGRFAFCTIANDVTVAANILAILFRAYIPFGLMLAFDIIVLKRLRKSKRRVAVTQMGQRKQPGQVSNKEYNFIVSTILIDIAFLLFYTPIAAYISMTVADVYVNWDRLATAAINLLYSCAMLTAYLYSVWLLVIFFIFNRYFRNEVYTVLRLNRLFPEISQTVMETGSTNNMNRSMN